MTLDKPGFYEFFAGGGMARLGLGSGWKCLFANDVSDKKAAAYRANFGPSPELVVDDIRRLSCSQLPVGAALAWASFPCQDLSLAGNGRGLTGERSSTFLPFWKLIDGLAREGRPVPIVVLENVVGALTSNRGADFQTLFDWIGASGYRAGALVIDAVHFVPQSRPRLFIVAVHDACDLPDNGGPSEPWHTKRIRAACAELPASLRRRWIWWSLPDPPARRRHLADIVESTPDWHDAFETDRLLSMMSPGNVAKIRSAQKSREPQIGTIYKRIRIENGRKVQRAEVRFDGIGGCLRTPAGGSSRQTLIVVEPEHIRTRLLTAREIARLMGVPDTYTLPSRYNEAYHLMGDGVVAPAVAWLEQHLLQPLADRVIVAV
jgi:DNA (cytosine-5)-methyltransferase 1